jgi:hypothetical protein
MLWSGFGGMMADPSGLLLGRRNREAR